MEYGDRKIILALSSTRTATDSGGGGITCPSGPLVPVGPSRDTTLQLLGRSVWEAIQVLGRYGVLLHAGMLEIAHEYSVRSIQCIYC